MENKEKIVFVPALSKCGSFVDYFGNTISIGDTIVFKANDYRNDDNFYRAKVKDLITQKGECGCDYCVLEDVESPHLLGKVKNGSKKMCHLCIIVK